MNEKERKAKYDKFLTVKEKFKNIPGVIDVAVGKKQVKGKFIDESVYIVYVEEKKRKEDLPPGHVIPEEINGVKTDVVKIRTEKNLIRPVRGGVKMDCEGKSGTGTLGCLATHPDHGTVLLTNHHVLYDQSYDNTPSAVERDVKVGQPGISCSWCCECNVIGHVKNSRRRNNGNVDCGIATIKPDVDFVNEILGGRRIEGIAPLKAHPVSGEMVPALEDDPVKKVGARTGYTEGIVKRVGVPVNVENSDDSITRFTDQIEFEHKDGSDKKVIDKGDSGSVLLNEDNQVVGLIMAGLVDSAPYDGTANNIYNVVHEDVMNITINQSPAAGGDTAMVEYEAQAIQSLIDLDDENRYYQKYFDRYQQLLESTSRGRDLLRCLKQHAPEIKELVNHNRQVIVAWQRHQGPAYVALVVRKLKMDDESLAKQINDIKLYDLLKSMHEVLNKTGSEALILDINKYADDIFESLENCHTNQEFIQALTKSTIPEI
ncbi:MAG: hypothetical protein R6U46_11745 [Marinilabilia sp.]